MDQDQNCLVDVSDDTQVVIDKRIKKREMVMNEIMSSEAEYLNRLLTLRDVYLIPIREGNILSSSEFAGQFWQLESIYDLHVKLFTELSNDFNVGAKQVGKIFNDFSHFLKMYKQYLSCFAGGSMAKRATLLTSNKKFSDFVYTAQKDPRCLGMTLDSFLIEPVQRIPRYCMLLDELLKNTDETHPDFDNIKTCVINVRKVAVENNEAIRRQEEAHKIYEVVLQISSQRSDTSSNLLDDPNRKFILQGDLVRQCRNFRKTFRFWLFSDKLLYGEEEFSAIREGMYRVNHEIPLSRCNITTRNDIENNEFALRVQSPAKSFVLYFKVEEKRNEWANAILTAIRASRCSLDNHRLAPVWKVDSSTDECELCFDRFTLFNRKHHCRKCGSVVCHDCSSNRALLEYVDPRNEVRVCDNCFIYKTGTLNMGITESNDYTVDLTGLVNEIVEEDDADSFNNSFNSHCSTSNRRASAVLSPITTHSSTSSRYRDSFSNAEIKSIQEYRNRNVTERVADIEEESTYSCWYYCCPCLSCEDVTKSTVMSHSDPLLGRSPSNVE